MATIKARQLIFPPLFVVIDTESRIRDPKGKKIRIRKNHQDPQHCLELMAEAKRNQVQKKRYVEQT
jgi:hypothetical protein